MLQKCCIYLVIAISSLSFQNVIAITTGLFDFYKMVITVITILKQVIFRD